MAIRRVLDRCRASSNADDLPAAVQECARERGADTGCRAGDERYPKARTTRQSYLSK
jgi:hypothetical protein